MSIISSVVVYLVICFTIMSLSASTTAGRHIGVVNKVSQDSTTLLHPTKTISSLERKANSIDTPSKSNATLLSNRHEAKVNVFMATNLASKDAHYNALDINVVNLKGRRSNGGERISDNSKNIKSKKKIPKQVSWRVPKKRRGVPETGFNLDYAPPKVHPPTHN